ncbi:unnamed protein product [Sphenostylis stenocarpa]|uniref:Uncharacterized protein n=1 Tax=Sphenostylis stenocarpa TaxID=92480 RepID=A0AA86S533_9FABA|nr:unnamed protein product [Sphenostylis stenocarpa]
MMPLLDYTFAENGSPLNGSSCGLSAETLKRFVRRRGMHRPLQKKRLLSTGKIRSGIRVDGDDSFSVNDSFSADSMYQSLLAKSTNKFGFQLFAFG